MRKAKSACPINLTLELLGDSWSLIVLRDVIFGDRRTFRELLIRSEEGIASNVLADRLRRLVDAGLLVRNGDVTHAQRTRLSLTECAIELVPLLVQLGTWGCRHLPVTPEMAARALLFEKGGPVLWSEFMDELRVSHIAGGPPGSILARVEQTFQAASEPKGI